MRHCRPLSLKSYINEWGKYRGDNTACSRATEDLEHGRLHFIITTVKLTNRWVGFMAEARSEKPLDVRRSESMVRGQDLFRGVFQCSSYSNICVV